MQKYDSAKHTHEQMEKIQTLLIQLLWIQLQSAGFFTEKESTFSRMKEKVGLIGVYEKWFEASVAFLEVHRFLERNGDLCILRNTSLPDREAIWKEWDRHRADWLEDPNRKARFILMENMIRAIPDIITGKLLATEVMFPNSSMELVEGIYKHNVIADYFNSVLADQVIAYVLKIKENNSGDRVRILEIGAGTGGTSAMVLRQLKPYHDSIAEYCYTDVSKAFLMHGEREYGSSNPFLTYKHLDIGQPVAAQDINIGGYDLIIAANVLHATKNIRQTLRNAKALLKQKGLILLNELTDNSLTIHLTFSLIEGWWLYEDATIRIPGCPGLYPDEWKKALEMEGYQAVAFPAASARELGQQIIVAESDGLIRLPRQAASAIEQIERQAESAAMQQPLSAEIIEETRHSRTEVSESRLEDAVKDTIAGKISESLKIDRSLIDPDAAFSDYGVDSITGVQLIQAINQMLHMKLKTTDLFDYGSLERLTDHIVSDNKEFLSQLLFDDSMLPSAQALPISDQVKILPGAGDQFLSRTRLESDQADQKEKDAIAIIGLSGRFASSASVHELWEHLAGGTDLVQEVTRWDLSKHYPDGANYCRHGSFLEHIDRFDPMFFMISGIEAAYMDPQQRIFLEESWKALEDAGYAGASVEGRRCGVYIGSGQMDYRNLTGDCPPAQAYWGNASSITSARIAYYLDLQGPAITIDTACSSSLIAIHLACQGLWANETEMALAGGVFVMSTPDFYVTTNRAGMFSSKGRCYTFDDRADGFVPGEGAGVVVLKRLRDAIADGDHIYGVIRGTGINQDGATNGITAPSAKSQERLQQYVYDTFSINPEHIQMIEAHGTGTQLGDPIEYEALSRTFSKYTNKKEFCAIGSIKTNIGHLTAAAGIAGLIKILLCLKHKKIAPSLHYRTGNPNIEFKDSPFYVNTSLQDWQVEPGKKRMAAISSFGFSGTNAHLVIEEAPETVSSFTTKPGYIILLSAQTPEQLSQQAGQLADFCERSAIHAGNISWTLWKGRKHWNHRLAFVVRHENEITGLLRNWLNTGTDPDVYVSGMQDAERQDSRAWTRYGNDCIRQCSSEKNNAVYVERLSAIAELFVQGCNLTFDELFADGGYSRVSLPTYPFANERYWVPEPTNGTYGMNGSSTSFSSSILQVRQEYPDDPANECFIEKQSRRVDESSALRALGEDQLQEKTVVHLIQLLASTALLPESRIEAGEPLEHYGIDSIMITKMTVRLEQTFGPLPKTLFFEYSTIRELAAYFVQSHRDRLNEIWGGAERQFEPSVASMQASLKSNSERCAGSSGSKSDAQLKSSTAPLKAEQAAERMDIAIIGLSGRYPGANNVGELWDNLYSAKDCITEIPPERWDFRLHFQEASIGNGKKQSKWGGFLDGVNRFDPMFFNISPRDAEMMDPQERLFLECVYEVIEDAGYTREALRARPEQGSSKDVGVFVGVTYEEYQLFGAQAQALGQPYALVGSPASIANRVSYYFNFHGPSVAMDTMCSSSLTALHYACQSLRNGECGLAIAGGVNVSVHPNKYLMLTQGNFLSSKGRCESFGEEGDGYVPGEGVGAVLLKPLALAEADGDHIYGVIKGTAVNHGGKTNGYTVPNPNAQAVVIERALKDAGVHPRTISYIEAHGTGTSLGDPIEIAGLSKAYRPYTSDTRFCAIGSVKSNIGHCESAAGIAGVTKVLLQFKHKLLVPSLHSGAKNSNIDFNETPFTVQQELVDWNRPVVEIDGITQEYPRIAGISSFGAGGVNAHVIIEEYTPADINQQFLEPKDGALSEEPALVLLSARNDDRLNAQVIRLLTALEEPAYVDANLRDIAYTLQVGREAMDERLALLVHSLDELRTKLNHYVEGVTDDHVIRGHAKSHKAAMDVFEADEELGEAVQKWMERGKYAKLLDLWVKGLHVDWQRIYAGNERMPRRVSLPTYPFAEEHYWVPVPEAGKKEIVVPEAKITPHLHPFLHNTSDLCRQRYSSTFTGQEWFFIQQRTDGRAVLAEGSYLEMAHAAVTYAAGLQAEDHVTVKLHDVIWNNRIGTESDPVQTHIELYWLDHDDIGYEIYVETEDGNTISCQQGRASLHDTAAAEFIDVDALLAECCRNGLSPAECDERLDQFSELEISRNEASVDRCRIETMRVAEGQALVKLSLTSDQTDAEKMLALHPSMLQAALQVAASFATERSAESKSTSMVRMLSDVRELEVLHPYSASLWVWIRITNENKDHHVLDMELIDDEGHVCARLRGLNFERHMEFATAGTVHGTGTTSTVPQLDDPVIRPEAAFETMTFEEIWTEQEMPRSSASGSESLRSIVCFLSGRENRQAAKDMIRLLHPEAKMAFITQDSSSCDAGTSDCLYSVTSDDGQSYKEAFRKLREVQGEPDAVFYMWATEDQSKVRDYSCIVFVLQALNAEKIKPSQFVLAGGYEHALDFCYLDSWIGFKQSLRLVMPQLRVSVILQNLREGSSIPGFAEQMSNICNELRNGDAQCVLYKDGKRFVNQIQPTALAITDGTRSIRSAGTYLITGGAGGLGLMFARSLAASHAVNLILVGRSALKEAKQAKIKELEALGSQVLYLQADISDREGMRSGLIQARQRFGNINGVIHAAGSMSSKTIFDKDIAEFKGILEPKVEGTLVLDELLKEDDPDFVCYFSSSSAILGDFGFCDYAVANRFQMSYAQYRNLQNPGKTVAINWPLWKNGGMSFSNDVSTQMYLKTSGQRLLDDAEGVALFERIISHNAPQHLIMVGQRERVHRFLGLGEQPNQPTQARTAEQKHSLPSVPGASLKGRVPEMKGLSEGKCVEWDLKQMTAGLLKISRDQLGLDENLAEFGFDSVSLAEFAGLIAEHYQVDITPALFFEYSTLRRFAQFLLQSFPDTIRAFYGHPAAENAESRRSSDASSVQRTVLAADASVSSRSGSQTLHQLSLLRKQGERLRFPVKGSGKKNSLLIDEPIAIIGMSGRFPQARSIDELWTILIGNQEAVTSIAQERPFIESLKQSSWRGGFVPGVSEFDPLFFEISPREAENMDPRQRLLLQEAWKALEDAGYGSKQLASNKIGMFVGVENNDDYSKISNQNGSITSNHHAIMAARLSYFLNLCGPNMAINTACSSGLVALHQACMSLRMSECDTAIAAGISLLLAEESFAAMSQAGMLSEEGRCYAFDQRANGMVPAEAVAAIVLKKLSCAERDGDPIYAVIQGSGINHDGRTNGITAPSGVAQTNLVKDVYSQFGVHPEEIEYIVTHGTGTKLGDPVEINALIQAFRERTDKENYCAITSSKANLGHTLAASGLVNVIGLVQSMRHGVIPASLHCERENEYIRWKNSPFYVNKQNKPWIPNGDRRRTGAASAFGMSGTNAHVIVRSYERETLQVMSDEAACYLLPLSAKTEAALQNQIRQMAEALASEGEMSFPCQTSATRCFREDIISSTAARSSLPMLKRRSRLGVGKPTVRRSSRMCSGE
ncbi:Amino acid adenylation domain-containing protein (fragment) [Paenibacillus alvei]|uniref:Amino acid adenylation domain-containing protein n=1 Tax=Paenibacillus alvei TaxID=44250 RepID=A0A383RB99_PAEAL